MNAYKFFYGRALMRKNPTFGTRIYIGAQRYKYYVDGHERYYYSDRPYTLEDAKKWKKRGLICNLILSVCFILAPIEGAQYISDSLMLLANIVCVALTVWFVAKTILFLIMDPNKDPMIESSPCTSDKEKAEEEW